MYIMYVDQHGGAIMGFYLRILVEKRRKYFLPALQRPLFVKTTLKKWVVSMKTSLLILKM